MSVPNSEHLPTVQRYVKYAIEDDENPGQWSYFYEPRDDHRAVWVQDDTGEFVLINSVAV